MKKSACEKFKERCKKAAQKLIDDNEQNLVLTIKFSLPAYLKYRKDNPEISLKDGFIDVESLGVFNAGDKILEYYYKLKKKK